MKSGIFSFLLLITVSASACTIPSPESRDPEAIKSLQSEIQSSNCNNDLRLEKTTGLFGRLGLPFRLRKYENATNVTVSVVGRGSDTVVVGAHYDKTESGCGAIDNWTGVVLLAHLAKWSGEKGLQKNYSFTAFGEEEKGLVGSAAMAGEILAAGEGRPCAMVNLDSFGFEKAWALANVSDRPVLMLAADVERERGGSFSIRNYRRATSDSSSFQKIGVPSITFSGLDKNWREYLHKESDQAGLIDVEMVNDNYLYLREFLLKLDSVSCDSLMG